jgi:hypothetical protein
MISPQRNTSRHIVYGDLCKFWLADDDILRVIVSDKFITEQDLHKEFIRILQYLNGRKVPVYFDATNISPIDKKVRLMLEVFLEDNFSSLAVVSNSTIGMAVANIFFGLSGSSFPKKFFLNEKSAIHWLTSRYTN